MSSERSVTRVVSISDWMTNYERAANHSFRGLIYDCAAALPEDVQAVLTEWHQKNGGIVPWLRAMGGEANRAEADRLEAEDRRREEAMWGSAVRGSP